MSIIDRLRQKFVDAGRYVSPTDEVELDSFAWYLGKATKTVRNWGKDAWPAHRKVGGSIRIPLEAIMAWEIERFDRAA